MKFKVLFVCLFFVATFFVSFPGLAQSSSPQDTLNQYVADLQKNPDDNALREKIIKLVQEMTPAPVIPEEARRHYVKASTLLEDAKQPSEYADAADEFRQALLVAPWWGESYMKMGMVLEIAGRYADAIASLKLFMATNPEDDMLRKTQDEIYKIEAKQEKAIKDAASPDVAATREQNEFKEWLKKVDGARYNIYNREGNGYTTHIEAYVSGTKLIYRNIDVDTGMATDGFMPMEIRSHEFTVMNTNTAVFPSTAEYAVKITDDTIVLRIRSYTGGWGQDYVFHREK
jgi:hypothetical protein